MNDFRSLLEKAFSKRSSLLELTDAFRVVNGSDDGFPGVAIDQYGDRFQVQYFGPELLSREQEIATAVKEVFAPKFIVSKFRLSPSGKSLEKPEMHVELGSETESSTIVREGNCRFHVDLLDTVNPGLFLDMRDGRLDVEARARGKEVLNLFSYTCSFAVHARVGGATRAVNADISGKILEKGRENYRLNGLEPLKGEFFKGDSREYLAWCLRKGFKFDGVVLDPPSFSRNKGKVFSVKTDFQTLVAEVAGLLAPGAFFLASTNYSAFTPEGLAKETLATVKEQFPKAKIAWARGQGMDFPGSGKRKESALSAVMIEVG
ncbi:MAG: class I SAM-dependent methyltransferase [Fibrobacter sp.]|nr:class I SAM-dependent methyltransferase [Fibrobacter sp.]